MENMRHKQIGEKLVGTDKKTGTVVFEWVVKKGAQLQEPQTYRSIRGEEAFDPVLYLVEDKRGDKSFWFPYWIKVRGKWRYGQYAPIFDESQFLELLLEAIRQDFFSAHFLKGLEQAIQVNRNKAARELFQEGRREGQ